MNDRAVETPPDEPDEELEGFAQCDLYEFVREPDQKLRCFIVEKMASADIDGRKWIKDGSVPTQPATAKTKRIPLNAA